MPFVDCVDFSAQAARIVLGLVAGDGIELRVQHPDYFGRLIVDDAFGLLVPQRRHRDLAGVILVGRHVGFVKIVETVDGVWRQSGNDVVFKGPAVFLRPWDRICDRNQAIELFQRTIDQSAVSPGATVGDIEVVAPGLCFEAGGTVGGDAVAEPAFRALEAAAVCVLLRKLPPVHTPFISTPILVPRSHGLVRSIAKWLIPAQICTRTAKLAWSQLR